MRGNNREGYGENNTYGVEMYYGFFKNDKTHGYGKTIYANGRILQGFIKNGKSHGSSLDYFGLRNFEEC